jgi:hypothetical protein
MTASDKCYQLASALASMTTAVPYEDVQTAATHIAQCAMNALTVSAPSPFVEIEEVAHMPF